MWVRWSFIAPGLLPGSDEASEMCGPTSSWSTLGAKGEARDLCFIWSAMSLTLAKNDTATRLGVPLAFGLLAGASVPEDYRRSLTA